MADSVKHTLRRLSASYSVFVSDDYALRDMSVTVLPDEYDAMGRPDTITVTIEPGEGANVAHENERLLLGLATTRELLAELAVRMEVTQNSTNGRTLGRLCRDALENLDGLVLSYRTVDKR